MASCQEFVVDRKHLWEVIARLEEEAEFSRKNNFIAARKIQVRLEKFSYQN